MASDNLMLLQHILSSESALLRVGLFIISLACLQLDLQVYSFWNLRKVQVAITVLARFGGVPRQSAVSFPSTPECLGIHSVPVTQNSKRTMTFQQQVKGNRSS